MVNVLVMLIVIWLAGVSVKDFACILVEKNRLIGEGTDFSYNRTMNVYLIRASLIAMVVASIIHFVFIKKILSPLKRLTASTRQLTDGSYPEPIKVPSEDEIGQLTRYFNDMAFALKRSAENRKRMLSNVSHDLRTPLSNLNGYLEALSSGVLTGDRDLYLSLLEESQHITRLVEQLHQLSVWEDRETAGMAFSAVQIDELIARCVQSFQLEQQARDMELDVSLERDVVTCDEGGLRQVLNNLIQNAFSYSTGRIIWVTGSAAPSGYRITVSNIGEPLPEEVQELVFERFFQADPARQRGEHAKGSGLGLAIVKEIVEKHGGEAGLISENNKHSFWVTIPRSPKKK